MSTCSLCTDLEKVCLLGSEEESIEGEARQKKGRLGNFPPRRTTDMSMGQADLRRQGFDSMEGSLRRMCFGLLGLQTSQDAWSRVRSGARRRNDFCHPSRGASVKVGLRQDSIWMLQS